MSSPSPTGAIEYSSCQSPNFVPSHPAGNGTGCASHVLTVTAWTHPAKSSSFWLQVKPLLQQALVSQHSCPAQEQPAPIFSRSSSWPGTPVWKARGPRIFPDHFGMAVLLKESMHV